MVRFFLFPLQATLYPPLYRVVSPTYKIALSRPKPLVLSSYMWELPFLHIILTWSSFYLILGVRFFQLEGETWVEVLPT